MFKYLLLAIAMLFTAPTFAQSTGPNPCENLAEATRGLRGDQVAVILESCRSSVTDTVVSKVAETITPENLTTWGQVAANFGEAIGNAAKELGIATNEFLNSPAGYLLVFLLLVNYAGGIVVALPFTMFALYVMSRLLRNEEVTYTRVPVLWGLFTVRRVDKRTRVEMTESQALYAVIYCIALAVFTLLVWLNT